MMWRPSAQDAECWAAEWGTPFYAYDISTATERIARLRESTRGAVALWYALKANSNLSLLRALEPTLDGADVASRGELKQAFRAGFTSDRIGFTGPAKTSVDLVAAVRSQVRVSVESLDEVEALAAVAKNEGMVARMSLRINPTERRHAFRVATGGVSGPFGIEEDDFEAAVSMVRHYASHLNCDGLHVHAGSQCTSATGWHAHAVSTLDLAAQAMASGLSLSVINLGGGLATIDHGMNVEQLGAKLCDSLAKFHKVFPGVQIVLEPGRYVVAESGRYVCRVVRTLRSRGEEIAVLDGGVNSFLFAAERVHGGPSLEVVNLGRATDTDMKRVRLVGPTCTPLDTLGTFEIASPCKGDLLSIGPAGAYALSASPLFFLGHETPAELLHESGEVRCIRSRRCLEDYD